jgi:cell division transport system ATP-binding protein
MIVLKHVTKKFGERTALSNVTLRIDPGECVCVVGHGDAGKTTLLRLLVGAEEATSGKIEVDGVDLRAIPPLALRLYRRRVGMMFQDGKLLSHCTVEENASLPLEIAGAPEAVIRKRVSSLLEGIGLSAKRRALPKELTSLERAKTSFARAVIGKPMIFLADEPTDGLEDAEAQQILALLREVRSTGATIIIATRDENVAAALGARVITLEKGATTGEEPVHERETRAQPVSPFATEEATVAAEQLVKPQKKIKITSIGSL